MRLLFSCIAILFFLPRPGQSQQTDSTLEVVPLRETIVAANRSSQTRTAVAQQVVVLRQAAIRQANAQTTAELMSNTAGIFIQKSQQGGGSPVLRGFEANRVLLVVDGVRMNNAIYRSGHLQNIITLDNAALERVELLFGPASTVYGSDALGGAVCFFTKNPELAGNGASFRSAGSAFGRYGSVNSEKTVHADISLGGRRLGALTSFTVSDFSDLRMGAQTGSRDPFGERPFYVARMGGRDSLVANDNPLVQRHSGYRQYDALQKFLWQPNDRDRHILNIQYSTSSDVPRYDRLTDPGAGDSGLRFAEWYYGPQKRLMTSYHFDRSSAGWFDRAGFTVSWQDIEESRHQRRFGRTDLQHRLEQVDVYGLESEAQKNWTHHSLRLGLDAQANRVASSAYEENIETGAESPLDTRYPDGGSSLYHFAVFATHNWQLPATSRWSFSEGLRAGYSTLSATFNDQTFFPFPFRQVKQNTPVWSASLGAVFRPATRWRMALNAASGFRVPNVDDLGKVFESQPGAVIVPNPDIKPEQTLNFDLSLNYEIAGRLRWENVLWGTLMRNAIVTDAFQFNGQDSIEFDGVLSRVLANQNKNRARLWGLSSTFEADLGDRTGAYASIAYTRGRVVQPGDDQPLDHIPPLHGRAGLRYHTSRLNGECVVLFHGKKPIEEYSSSGEDNQRYAPADGMPAWMTLNVRCGYRLGQHLGLQAGVDNLLDRQYRVFASGINAPGRNFWITLRVDW